MKEVLKLYQEIEESYLKKIKLSIEKIRQDQKFLGEGRAGRVYTCEEETFCIKEIINASPDFSFNDIEIEMEIQIEVKKYGIRVPMPMLLFQNSSGQKFLVMERIFGASIQDIEEGKADFPTNFNAEEFFEEVKAMVAKMHKNNLYHRDLHSGNLMIEVKDGKIKPVIIDFGHSSHSYGEDDPYKEKNFPRIGHTKIFPKDDLEIKRMKDRIILMLTKKQ